MICVIVLHYKNWMVTQKCVASVLKVMEKDSRILVVDNGSLDGSGERLAEIFRAEERVEVIVGKERLGFSAGNNLGYRAARKYAPEFIIDLNNDILIKQPDFFAKLRQIHAETGFDIMGPDVYAPKCREHQSPLRMDYATREKTERGIAMYQRRLQALDHPTLKTKLIVLMRHYFPRAMAVIERRILGRNTGRRTVIDHRKQYRMVGLIGCCLIFSPSYLEKYDRLFEPETNFYSEENILLLKCVRNHLMILYDPRCQVLHNHGGAQSIKLAYSNAFKRARFLYESYIESMKVYLDYLGDEEKK